MIIWADDEYKKIISDESSFAKVIDNLDAIDVMGPINKIIDGFESEDS